MAYDPHLYRRLETVAPEALLRQAILLVGVMMLLVVLTVHLPWVFLDLDQPANPASPPPGLTHTWVFGPAAALMRLLGSPLAGLIILGWLFLAGLFLPFWDKTFRRRFAWRPLFSKAFVLLLACWAGLLVWSAFLPLSARVGQ